MLKFKIIILNLKKRDASKFHTAIFASCMKRLRMVVTNWQIPISWQKREEFSGRKQKEKTREFIFISVSAFQRNFILEAYHKHTFVWQYHRNTERECEVKSIKFYMNSRYLSQSAHLIMKMRKYKKGTANFKQEEKVD